MSEGTTSDFEKLSDCLSVIVIPETTRDSEAIWGGAGMVGLGNSELLGFSLTGHNTT